MAQPIARLLDLPGALADRAPIDGQTVAYRCLGTHCEMPVTTWEALAAQLAVRADPRDWRVRLHFARTLFYCDEMEAAAQELEAVELCDLPRIELKDGNEYKDSLTLSTGQKCTTILPIELSGYLMPGPSRRW